MINNVTLVGRLTKDIELKYTQSGTAVANFTLAVNRPYKNNEGDYDADFIQIVVWRKAAETIAKYTRKGSQIGITGSIRTRSYDKNGQTIYVTEVAAEQFAFLDSKKDASANNNRGSYETPSARTKDVMPPKSASFDDDPFDNDANIDISDDDLPF